MDVDIQGLIYFGSVLVNNAGFVLGKDEVGDIKEEDIDAMFATNVFGLMSVTQLLLKGMNYGRLSSCTTYLFYVEFKQKQSGHIINLGSIAGYVSCLDQWSISPS